MRYLYYVEPSQLHTVWDKVSPYLEKAMEHSGGEYNLDQLKVFLSQGLQALIVFIDNANSNIIGAVTVEFINYPNERVAFVTSVGGKALASRDLWDQFEAWCKQNGATMVRGAAFESVARLWKKAFGVESDRKSTRLNSSHSQQSRMPSSA